VKLIVLEPAQNEVRDATDYYSEHNPTAARAFVEEIRRSFTVIKAHPLRGPSTEEGERKYVARTFPYTIIYRVTGTTVVVLAVAHHRREWGYWRTRGTG
jgi:toxin ParE1/3/4